MKVGSVRELDFLATIAPVPNVWQGNSEASIFLFKSSMSSNGFIEFAHFAFP
jgi:hypothetical protein